MNQISILYIEDNAADVRLIKELLKEIKRSAYNLFSAGTLKDGIEQIKKNNFDIILLDLNLPDSIGFQTFSNIHNCCNGIPLVLVTGDKDEDLSLKLITEGAQDYISKNNMNAILIEKTIQYAIERNKSEQELRKSEEKYRYLIDNMNEGVFIADKKGKITFANMALARIHGFDSPDKMLNKSFIDFVDTSMRDELEQSYKTEIQSGEILPIRFFSIIKTDGSKGYVQVQPHLIYEGEKIVGTMGIMQDITERKQAQKELMESEKKFRSYIDRAPSGIFIIDNTGKYIELNKPAYQKIGYTEEEFKKSHISDMLAEESVNDGLQHFEHLIKTGSASADLWHKHKDGSKLCLTIDAVKLTDNSFLGFARDITPKKIVEAELKQSEEKFRKIFEESPIGMIMSDNTLQFTQINSSFADMLGYSKKELLQMKFKDFTHPEHLEQDIENVSKLINGEITKYKTEKRYIKKTGEIIWGALTLTKITDSKGNFQFNIGMIEDITYRKSIQIKLEQMVESRTKELSKVNSQLQIQLEKEKEQESFLSYSESLNRTTINAINDYILIFDKSLTVLMANNAALNLFSKTKDLKNTNIIGQNIEIILPVINKKYAPKIKKVFETTTEIKFEGSTDRFEGVMKFFEITLSPIQVENKVERIVLFARDISKIKKVEEEILQNLEKERELNELKSRFISIISHEFRTPLAGIQSSIELIEKYNEKLEKTKKEEIFHTIYKSIKHTITLLDNISIIGKEQSGRLKVSLSLCDIEGLCKISISDVCAKYKKEANIHMDIAQNINTTIDEELMRQVLVNLLSNAVKYSAPQQQVDLIAQIENNQLKIIVKDKGIGIPENDLKYIFDAFHRASNAEKIKGTGLGLTIVKQCVELHKGIIQINSKLNEGTEVIVKIPLNADVNI